MFSVLKSFFAKRHRRYEWDELHAIGSSKLVQLTVVLPVIGYLILFNAALKNYLVLYVDMGGGIVEWRLYALYFGFCCLSIGALIFAARCPSEIKTHGAGFVFVARELLVYRAGDRAGQIQRILIGLRLGLIDPHGTLHSLPRETLDSLRKDNQEVDRVAREIEGGENRNLELTMLEYFVALKASRRKSRIAARCFYDAGFALVALPTLAVFGSVVTSFVDLMA